VLRPSSCFARSESSAGSARRNAEGSFRVSGMCPLHLHCPGLIRKALVVCVVYSRLTKGVSCDWRRSSWFRQFSDSSSNAQLQRAISVYCARSKDLWRSRAVQDLVGSVAAEMASGRVNTTLQERQTIMEMYERDAGYELPALVKVKNKLCGFVIV
jgi:hypothetical protein